MNKFRVFVYMLMRDASLKQRIPCIMRISIFGAFSAGKKCALYTGKYGTLSKHVTQTITGCSHIMPCLSRVTCKPISQQLIKNTNVVFAFRNNKSGASVHKYVNGLLPFKSSILLTI